jgi:hypothetical protein
MMYCYKANGTLHRYTVLPGLFCDLRSFVNGYTFEPKQHYPLPEFTVEYMGDATRLNFPTYYSPMSPFAAVVQSLVGFEVGRRMEGLFTVPMDENRKTEHRNGTTKAVLEDFQFDKDGIRAHWKKTGILYSLTTHIFNADRS